MSKIISGEGRRHRTIPIGTQCNRLNPKGLNAIGDGMGYGGNVFATDCLGPEAYADQSTAFCDSHHHVVADISLTVAMTFKAGVTHNDGAVDKIQHIVDNLWLGVRYIDHVAHAVHQAHCLAAEVRQSGI